ncbi:MAG: hypothetical protein DMG41_19905 [Acidobacteria bacterium]|nr:MAG: hypothetical protein AUH13_23025 [Acidobacteria bacterium 13_2_20CM_58_27]PYT77172.1 MAG: hypothetical protein DMG42_03130 [Acidobacteriota bacterium]PYT86409.1 MAG: hypothetical protein DMG41_19905 [Acidobacteriota bacterium]
MPARVIGKVPVPGHNRSSDVIRHVSIETISLKRVYDYNDNGRNQKRTAEVETTDMSSGDPQRTWFPEMIVRLRADWQAEMSMPALISLRDDLEGMLRRIRAGHDIKTPIITCRRCGFTGPAAEPHVSVRALILALARFEIASKEQTRALEKAWAAHRKEHRLDREGKLSAGIPESCQH